MAGLIEEEFETAVSEGRPLFNYTTTIQNHMSYTADKYGEGYVPPVSTTADISPETRSMLEVYTEGVRDADAMLGRLTAYFAEREEPVVLYSTATTCPIWGTTRRAMRSWDLRCPFRKTSGRTFSALTRPPMCSGPMTPPRDTLNWNEAVAALDLPEDGVLSASFLGSVLLDLTGRAGKVRGSTFSPPSGGSRRWYKKKPISWRTAPYCPSEFLNEQTDEASMELKMPSASGAAGAITS